VPWVSDEEETVSIDGNGEGRRPFWGRGNGHAPDRDRVGA